MEEDHEPTLLTPRVLVPFIICTLIWGSTWIVIRDQLGSVPVTWSVTYRFIVAGAAMMLFALWKGHSLRLSRQGHLLALAVGLFQFVGNFNFVYRAEEHITSGLVAVLFALLIIPNSLLGRAFVGTKLTGRFLLGGGIAVVGVALMIAQEYRVADVGPQAVLLGAGLTIGGILCASIANVMQGSRLARAQQMVVMLAYAMLYGALMDGVYAWFTAGPPVIDMRWGYLAGVAYLGIFASAVTFPLYFGIIRAVGPAQSAWASVLVPVIAMAISTVVEDYVWATLSIAGAVVAGAGLVVAIRARPKRPTVTANMTPVAVVGEIEPAKPL